MSVRVELSLGPNKTLDNVSIEPLLGGRKAEFHNAKVWPEFGSHDRLESAMIEFVLVHNGALQKVKLLLVISGEMLSVSRQNVTTETVRVEFELGEHSQFKRITAELVLAP